MRLDALYLCSIKTANGNSHSIPNEQWTLILITGLPMANPVIQSLLEKAENVRELREVGGGDATPIRFFLNFSETNSHLDLPVSEVVRTFLTHLLTQDW